MKENNSRGKLHEILLPFTSLTFLTSSIDITRSSIFFRPLYSLNLFFIFIHPFFIFSISSIVIHFQSFSFTFMYTSSSTFIITPINFSESMLSNMTFIAPRESEYHNRSMRKNLTDKKSLLGSVSLA